MRQQFLYFFPLPHGQGSLRPTGSRSIPLVSILSRLRGEVRRLPDLFEDHVEGTAVKDRGEFHDDCLHRSHILSVRSTRPWRMTVTNEREGALPPAHMG